MFQSPVMSYDFGTHVIWTVFSVARRTAGQQMLSNVRYLLIVVCIGCHIVAFINSLNADDNAQFITLSAMGILIAIFVCVSYIGLSRQVHLLTISFTCY
jgi:hypothetical protein